MVSTALALLVLALPRLHESPLGYTIELPAGFNEDARLPVGETGAAGPARRGGRAVIDAAFSDVATGGRESLFTSVVDADLPSGGSATTELAALTLDWAEQRLGGQFELQWVDRLGTAAGRAVEVAGRLRQPREGGDPDDHALLVAFWPFGRGYLACVASVPADRFALEGPLLEQAFRTLRIRKPPRSSRGILGALLGAALGIGLVILVRRRGR